MESIKVVVAEVIVKVIQGHCQQRCLIHCMSLSVSSNRVLQDIITFSM